MANIQVLGYELLLCLLVLIDWRINDNFLVLKATKIVGEKRFDREHQIFAQINLVFEKDNKIEEALEKLIHPRM